MAQPILSNDDLEKIRRISDIEDNEFHALTLDMNGTRQAAQTACKPPDDLCAEAETAIAQRNENILILSDRAMRADRVAIPALLATSAVHIISYPQGPAHQPVWWSNR